MSFLDRDDRQMMVHNYRQVAEILALFRTSLVDAGIPRLLAGVLVLRHYDAIVRSSDGPSVVFIPPPFDMEEEE